MIRKTVSPNIIVTGGIFALTSLLLADHGVRADGRGGSGAALECVSVTAGTATTADGGVLIVGQSVIGRTADEGTIVTLGGLTCLYEPLPLCVNPGDMNADAEVNLLDFALFSTCFAQAPAGQDCTCADLNGDDLIDLADLAVLIAALNAR